MAFKIKLEPQATFKKFPAMIHFTVNEKTTLVIVRAVLNTHRNIDKLNA